MPGEKTAAMKTLSEAADAGDDCKPSAVHGARLDRRRFGISARFRACCLQAMPPLFSRRRSTTRPSPCCESAAHLLLSRPHEMSAHVWPRPTHAVQSGDSLARVPHWRRRHEPSPTRGCRTGSWDDFNCSLGDEAGALRSFQTAAALPSLGGAAHVYAAIGRIRHNQLDLDGAVSAYSRRVELTPNDAAAHVDLGDVYRAQDRLDEALAEYLDRVAPRCDERHARWRLRRRFMRPAAGTRQR